MAADFKALGRNTQVALVSGALAVLLTFFKSYIRVEGTNVSNAWDGFGTLACLLLVAAVAITAIKVFSADTLPKEVPWSLVTLAAAAVATLILVLKPFTVDVPSFAGDVSVGPGWSGWVLIISLLVFTAFTALLFKESGEKIPEINKKDTPPAA